MRDKMADMQQQMESFITFVRGELARGLSHSNERRARTAIVRAVPTKAIRIVK
jgi:hypothetical protein